MLKIFKVFYRVNIPSYAFLGVETQSNMLFCNYFAPYKICHELHGFYELYYVKILILIRVIRKIRDKPK